MTTPHNRKLKVVVFELDGVERQLQLESWTMENNSDDGEKGYTYAPNAEYVEDADPDYALNCTFLADWRNDGISDFLWAHNNETVPFTLDHHPDVAAEHVRWTGLLKIKAPTVGGDIRTTEKTEVTFPCVGEPAYTRVGA